MRSATLCLVVATLLLVTSTSARFASSQTLPGLKVTLSQDGLDYAKEVTLQLVQKQFQTINVPDQKGSAGASILGTIDWSLTSIVLSGLSISSSSTIAIQPNTGIAVSLNGASLTANMNFGYRQENWPHISGGGSLTIGMSGTTISILLQLGENSDHQPTVSDLSTSCSIGSLSVHESGGPSWLIDFVLNVLSGVIKNAVQNAVAPAIANLINNNVNQALHTLPMQQDIMGILELDYSFVAPPTLGQGYLTVNSRAEFYLLPNKPECPLLPDPLPDTTNSEMLQVFVDSYLPNSALYALYKGGYLQAELQDKDIPAWVPIRLNTIFWIPILPALAKYPDMPMVLQVQAATPPAIAFQPLGIDAKAPVQFTMSVVSNTTTLIPLFAFDLNVTANATAKVVGTTISGDLSNLNCTFHLQWSNIGPITIDQYSWIAEALCTYLMKPLANYGLEQGIKIPVFDGVALNAVTLNSSQGFLAVSSNVTYTPPAATSSSVLLLANI